MRIYANTSNAYEFQEILINSHKFAWQLITFYVGWLEFWIMQLEGLNLIRIYDPIQLGKEEL